MENTTTTVAPAFNWTDGTGGRVLACRPLGDAAAHVFSSRDLQDASDATRVDWTRLAPLLGVTSGRIVRVKQVHGRAVLRVEPGSVTPELPEADAIVSTDPDRAIAVRVADCVPVLLADRRGGVVAAVHAGWRGTCAGVTAQAMETAVAMGADPAEIVAAVGPSIGPCCYQVDEKVRHAFLAMTPDAAAWFAEDGPGRWKLDLWRANAEQLEAAGVPASSIHISRVCTAERLDVCFSYRREGATTGRLVAAIRARPRR